MRTISEIRKDIQELELNYRDELKRLNGEIDEFQSSCPHPDNMIVVKHKDYDDDYLGAARYDYTISTAFCLCCEKKVYSDSYRKNTYERVDNEKFKKMLKAS